jgi:hypothetical protein
MFKILLNIEKENILKVTFQAKHEINTLVKNHYISFPRLSMQKENFFETIVY